MWWGVDVCGGRCRFCDDRAGKLAVELDPGALVVDYGPWPPCGEEADGAGRFELAFQAELPVSWNAKQRFHVFRRQA